MSKRKAEFMVVVKTMGGNPAVHATIFSQMRCAHWQHDYVWGPLNPNCDFREIGFVTTRSQGESYVAVLHGWTIGRKDNGVQFSNKNMADAAKEAHDYYLGNLTPAPEPDRFYS